MVVVKLMGGLGNQLFQYAAARRVALVNNASLKLDISKFKNDKLRTYRLKHFNIKAEIADLADIMQAKGGAGISGQINRRLAKLKPYHRRLWIKERHLHFDPNILKLSSPVYLEGYWMSEKYFKDIEDTLRQEFTVKSKPSLINEQMAQDIHRTNSVSLHIRRGDKASNPVTSQLHGVCPPEYYQAAVEKIAGIVENPYLFIFSDDPRWTQENLRLEYQTTYVTHNGADQDFEDLCLMSQCKHHIVANSTFSWWGAWLGAYPQKIVIAPRQWSQYKNKDRIPETWDLL